MPMELRRANQGVILSPSYRITVCQTVTHQAGLLSLPVAISNPVAIPVQDNNLTSCDLLFPANIKRLMATIEVVSDVVCPWCFIGKRRLERALALLGKQDIPVCWKPFQLNPNAPKEGMNRKEYRARKFGSLEYAKQLEDRVAAAGALEDILFRFDRIERTPNTFDAHRLIWLATDQSAVVEKLF